MPTLRIGGKGRMLFFIEDENSRSHTSASEKKGKSFQEEKTFASSSFAASSPISRNGSPHRNTARRRPCFVICSLAALTMASAAS